MYHFIDDRIEVQRGNRLVLLNGSSKVIWLVRSRASVESLSSDSELVDFLIFMHSLIHSRTAKTIKCLPLPGLLLGFGKYISKRERIPVLRNLLTRRRHRWWSDA